MRNKVIAAIVAAALALTLTGCGEDEKSSTPASSSDETSSVSSSSVDNASSAAGSDSSSSETQGEQPSDPISGSPLQVVLYGGGRADFIITNALMDLNVGGDCDVWLVTPQTTYRIVLLVDNFSAEEKPKFECHFDELDRNKPDPYEADTHPLGDADYSYSGSTLTLSLDTSRYGVSIDFGSITEYILFNGSKGNGAAPWTFQPADVVVDKSGGASSSESSSSGGTTPVDPPSSFDAASMDFAGIYALAGDESEPYFFLLRWEQGYSFNFFKNYYWYSGRIIFEDYSKYYDWASNVFGTTNGGFDTLGVNFDGSFDPAMQESMMDHELSFNSDGTITLTVGHNGQSKTGTFVKIAEFPTES